ncbi:MAG: 4'-phosphopantetheinyl transferase family protein, partial [Planctomycetota bacterium]
MSAWLTPPDDLQLATDLVDVWRVPLDEHELPIDRFTTWLNEEEHAKADRYRIQAKRDEFLTVRGFLRGLLGQLLDEAPESFAFMYGPHGKPYLAQRFAGSTVSFNVSHSGKWALIGVMPQRQIGVDVERARPKVDIQGLAKRFFSPAEADDLMSLAPADRRDAFFACWTRKEAFVKAVGNGISLGLDSFDVTLRPGETPRLSATRWDTTEAARWTLLDLPMPTGYRAAAAIQGQD